MNDLEARDSVHPMRGERISIGGFRAQEPEKS